MSEQSWRRAVCGGLLLGALTGCGPSTATTGDESATGDETTGTTGDVPSTPTDPTDPTDPTVASTPTDPTMPTTGTDPEPTDGEVGAWVELVETRDVDVLLVIDNSGSMGEEQGRLAKNMASLIGKLEAVGANYRVGVTTTDSGNPRCPAAQTTPEGGNLVLSSCLDRVDQGEFEFNGDDFSSACTDHCTKRDADLTVRPTTAEGDPQERPRSWLERSEGSSNIGGVESNVEALQCYLPQGVAGCGFESHLESMYLALAKSQDPMNTQNFGFLRPSAQLAVVFVSDETDCSYAQVGKDIFTSNKVFWSDPDAATPTSAVCWRAGVACTGEGPSYSECHAANYDVKGAVGAPDDAAVLQPLSKYINFVQGIEDNKQVFVADQQVKVSLLTGVPVGYQEFLSELVYEDSPDPGLQDAFGVGPGCVLGDPNSPEMFAIPPVRERELAEAFAGDAAVRPLYSLCQDDYSQALAAIAEEIAEDIRPLCFPECAKDVQPDTALVDPSCSLLAENVVLATSVEVETCTLINGEWAPPPGQTLCYGLRSDRDGAQTPVPLDDMSPGCVDAGSNLEFVIVRSVAKQTGDQLRVRCELSNNPMMDCPVL